MTPYTFDGAAWQESWDRQQEAYLPDREERFAAMLDAVEAVTEWPAPRILDLAGGTGSISLRAQRRFPQANTTLLDLDPVTLTIARATLDERSTVVSANLNTPEWTAALPHRDYDAVLVATALHWLTPERLATLYTEIRTVLRQGGLLVNADHMPDDGLPDLSKRLGDRARNRREARYAAGAVLSWDAWWEHAKSDPTLGPLVAQRAELFAADHAQEWLPPASWHVRALRDAGFTEVGLIWRGAQDAAVAAVR
ncbi:class I SAM-dependent methyltransferase [Catenuloplanes atrovinosus]|uniref:SAM-dependent methyltransferase n=1 Tax=Catenuloplanes atrovinosus TaxID=137266 RepID=A0AAE3YUU0_9ACTN|nr:class I SAM-dependent methyltransferase [Catenuloplanes atrovinosus]MDR7278346.1 SAM-dependent methyltransferase [Catenuloplanes atrovinosus]